MKRLSFTGCLLYLVLSALATTVANGQQDYFTEEFSSFKAFDLSNKAIMFTPTAGGTSYLACLQEIIQLPTDPAGGTNLGLADDDYEFVRLSNQKTVSIFGSSFGGFYVGSNGYITFTEGDTFRLEALFTHFATIRISALFNDLNPSVGGAVLWKQFADRAVVTWQNVPVYRAVGSNTFQAEMYFDGRIRLAWLAVTAQQCVVGLSDGLGLQANFQQTDLSAYSLCEGSPSIPLIISGYVRTANGSGISDVLLAFSNDGGSTTTDSTGYYSNTVLPGWSGVVTPSKSGYAFNPPSISYSNVTSDVSGQNYTGSTGPPTILPAERFSSDADRFDLSNKSIMFTPVAGGISYNACLQGIGQLPTNPAGGSDLELLDDDYSFVRLSDQKTVSIFGSSFSSFYIGTNGYITFTQTDTEPVESLSAHFDTIRISALFRDLDPSIGGLLSWKQLADHVAVTWQNVPEYGSGGSNTFQVEMYFDGRIRLAWLAVTARLGVVGLSDGLGLPANFQETDLSAYSLCGGGPSINPIISGYVRTTGGSGISDVLLAFSNNGGSVITDSTGYYSNVLWPGWSGVVTPNKSGYAFNPPSISYSNVTSDISGQNYIGSVAAQPGLPTERFSSDADRFDLSNKAIMFTPTAGGTSYNICLQEVTSLPTGGTQLTLDDDDYEFVSLGDQKTVSIYGDSFPGFYVGSNGYITFTEGDTVPEESLSTHFQTWRISALFRDLDPSTGGAVSWIQLPDRVVVTWRDVPEYRTGGSNTFHVEMYFDGRIRLAWLTVTARMAVVGLSNGLGLWGGFQETDFSAYPLCGGGPSINPIIAGFVRTAGGSGISDVLLAFSNDGGSVTTDSSGYYSNELWPGWSGVVTPIKSGYIFEPRSISYNNVTSDASNQNYTGLVGFFDYFTENFSSSADAFDLSNQSIMFTPTAGGAFYGACVQKISQLPTDPAGGINLGLSDDSYEIVLLRNQKTVSIFGSSFPSFYVGSNGYITFTAGSTSNQWALSTHFATKRISVLFNDFDPDPNWGGEVSWKQLSDRVAVTWRDVPRFNPIYILPPNTFQVEMYFDGRIRLAWLVVDSQTGIVGLSNGLGLPVDFQETDLSMYPLCAGGPSINPIISGYVRTDGGSGVSGVLLAFSNDGGSTITDSSGYYSNVVLRSWSGVVTPSKSGYIFAPPSISYSNVTSNISDQNYTGMTLASLGYFTEQFSSDADPFDLSNKAVIFTPTADGNSYDISVQEITSLPTDPVGGTQLTLADDASAFVSLNNQKTVSIYGSSFPSFFVGSNGYITFTEGDIEYRAALSTHFAKMRISILFYDFNPAAAGVVSWKQLADHVAVTWQGVPGYGTTNSNTFQVQMYFDGRIRLAWLAIESVTGIVGLSEGLGLPADFQEIDFSQYQPGAPPPGDESPIGHWTMDDNAANTTVLDSSGKGNHGIAQQNTSALSTSGEIAGALTFNGASDYISCGNASSLDITGSVSISAWVWFNSLPNYQTIITKRGTVNDNAANYAFRTGTAPNQNQLEFYYYDGARWHVYTTSNTDLATGQWYHVVVTYTFGSGAGIKFYLDNNLLSGRWTLGNGNSPVQINTKPVTIGGLMGGAGVSGERLSGLIDDVRIYNRVLSQTEITALYNQGAGP